MASKNGQVSVDALLQSAQAAGATALAAKADRQRVSKQLKHVTDPTSKLLAPVGDHVAARAARRVAYEMAAKEVGKWQGLVGKEARQKQLNLIEEAGVARDQRVKSTTGAMADRFKATTAMERRLAAALGASGFDAASGDSRARRIEKAELAQKKSQQKKRGSKRPRERTTFAEAVESEQLFVDDGALDEDGGAALGRGSSSRAAQQKRAQQLASLRNLLFYEEQKRRWSNKIKSRAYRRVKKRQRQRQQEAQRAREEADDPALALKREEEEAMAAARARALGRAKGSGRATQARDAGEQAREREAALRARMRDDAAKAAAKDGWGDSDGSDSDSSDEQEEEQGKQAGRQSGADLSAIFGGEAEADSDSNSDQEEEKNKEGEGAGKGAATKVKPPVAVMPSLGVASLMVRSAPAQGVSVEQAAVAGAAAPAGTAAGDGSAMGEAQQEASGAAAGAASVGAGAGTGEASGGSSQQELVRRAFSGWGATEEDFEEEKQKAAEKAAPRVDGPMAGWGGGWAGADAPVDHRYERRRRAAEQRRQQNIKDTLKRRQDAYKKGTVISERKDKKLSKLKVGEVPYPFKTREQYERAMRHPLGADWNTREVARELTAPNVVVRAGVMVGALQQEAVAKHGAKQRKQQATQQRRSSKGPSAKKRRR